MEELFDNETMKKRPQAPVKQVPGTQKAASVLPQNAKILYLRVPDLTCKSYLRAKNLLEIFDGTLPVSIFDASTKTYHKQSLGFDCTAYTIGELQKILGAENVVVK